MHARVLRTPEERFDNLEGYSFKPNYLEVDGGELGPLRMHYVDEGDNNAPVILCMHGEPTWSYLYRKMIPPLVEAGFRVVAPDLIGFGKSDKPALRNTYTQASHLGWMAQFIQQLDLTGITLVCQDWGGLLGLRLGVQMPERFARFTISNSGIVAGKAVGVGGNSFPFAILDWIQYSQNVVDFDAGLVVEQHTVNDLSQGAVAAYRAPFPSEEYKAGARQFPCLLTISPSHPEAAPATVDWEKFKVTEKPVLCAFGYHDPFFASVMMQIMQIPGAQGQPHKMLNAAHFSQEDAGEEWAQMVIDWIG
jgi:haloalkane dehalogenase|tara:strand:- start:2117 stop:3034 length:918 start_codon:yes stop_codon:yes gene_type:complete